MKKSKKEVSNSAIFYLLIGVVFVSLLGTVTVLNELGSSDVTGHATSVGYTNLTVVSRTEINFTANQIDFGAGYVDYSCNNCTMDSEGGMDSACCNNFTTVSDGFTIKNIGNNNVSLNLSFAKDADSLLGGTSSINSYQYKASNANDAGCTGTLDPTSYTEVSGSNIVCDEFTYGVGHDEMNVDIRVVLPYDSDLGTLTDTVTATGVTI